MNFLLSLVLSLSLSFSLGTVEAKQKEIGHPPFMSPHFSPIVVSEGKVFVANTPSDTVDVLDVSSNRVVRRIPVDTLSLYRLAPSAGLVAWMTAESTWS